MRRLVATVGLALAVVTVTGAYAAPGGSRSSPDLSVALHDGTACGAFGDSLPTIVSRSGVGPGDVAADVTVCVRLDTDNGRELNLLVTELVDSDPSCTGNEATLDLTCGAGRAGELGASLFQEAGVGRCMPDLPIGAASGAHLPDLQREALLLDPRLRKAEVRCVRLRLRYQPEGSAAASISQSDRTTWRYVFQVTATGQR